MSIFKILINNSKSDANRLYFNCVFHVKKENSIKIINNDETNSNYGEFIQFKPKTNWYGTKETNLLQYSYPQKKTYLSSSVTLDRLSIPENNQHGLKAKFSWQGERQNNLAKSQLKRHIPTRSPVILDHTNPSVLSDSILNFAPSEWTNTRNQFQANQAVFQAEPEIITIDNIDSIISSSHRRQPDTFAVDVQSSYQARTAGV